MTYNVLSESCHARKGAVIASFASFDEAQSFVEETYVVRYFDRDEDNDAADALVNYAKSPNGMAFCISIEVV